MQKGLLKKSASVSHVVLSQSAVTDPVPTAKAPVPPAYTPVKIGRGNRVKHAQVNVAAKVASELRGYADYTTVFGAAAPSADVVATALETAAGWSASLANAQAWFTYVKQQTTVAWGQAMGLTDVLKGPFDLNVARDATIGETIPSTAAFFGAPKAAAQKAAATRKKKAAETKKSAAAAAAPPPVTAAGSKAVN